MDDRRGVTARSAPARDRLTGALGGDGIAAELAAACAASDAAGENIAAGYVHVDQLTALTERHGAPFADQCLRDVARRLLESVRETDAIGRVDGPNFVIVFRGLAARIQSYALLSRIRARLAEPVKVAGLDVPLVAFCGLANRPMDGRTPHELVRAASIEMQKSKAAITAAAVLAGDENAAP